MQPFLIGFYKLGVTTLPRKFAPSPISSWTSIQESCFHRRIFLTFCLFLNPCKLQVKIRLRSRYLCTYCFLFYSPGHSDQRDALPQLWNDNLQGWRFFRPQYWRWPGRHELWIWIILLRRSGFSDWDEVFRQILLFKGKIPVIIKMDKYLCLTL